MLASDPQDPATFNSLKGPVAYALAGASVAGAALLLAFASPVVFVAGFAILTASAIVSAVGHRIAERKDNPSESWESTAAKIAACMENVNLTPEDIPGRFQAMVDDGREHAAKYRLH